MAVKPSVPPRRPSQQNDAALLEAVRAHWREVVRRARPVNNTARQDPATVAVSPSVSPRRPRQQNDASLHETVRAHWREVIHRARPIDNTARLDLGVDSAARTDLGVDSVAHTDLGVDARTVKRWRLRSTDRDSVAQRSFGVRQRAGALGEGDSLRTAVDNTVRADLGVDDTARADLGVDSTARLDPATVAVKPSVSPRPLRQQNDASLHEAVRTHWREVVHRARPVDNTARLDLGVDTTARTDLGVDTTARLDLGVNARTDLGVDNTARLDPDTVAVKPSVPPRRPRQQNHAALHEAVRARGRGGDVVRRARPVDSAARLRRGAVRPSVPPPRPRQQNHAALHEAVTVDEANLWRLRVKRTAVAFAAVLLFLALVVFSGRPFGGDDQPAPQPSVPSASGDTSSAATEQRPGTGFTWYPGCASRRLIRRHTATGPRRASVFRRH